jgi:hypothetical protein
VVARLGLQRLQVGRRQRHARDRGRGGRARHRRRRNRAGRGAASTPCIAPGDELSDPREWQHDRPLLELLRGGASGRAGDPAAAEARRRLAAHSTGIDRGGRRPYRSRRLPVSSQERDRPHSRSRSPQGCVASSRCRVSAYNRSRAGTIGRRASLALNLTPTTPVSRAGSGTTVSWPPGSATFGTGGTWNGIRADDFGIARMCPLSCPPAPANDAAEPKRSGIIIRVSGVRVPPPASEVALKTVTSRPHR